MYNYMSRRVGEMCIRINPGGSEMCIRLYWGKQARCI